MNQEKEVRDGNTRLPYLWLLPCAAGRHQGSGGCHRHEGEEYLFCCQGCLDLFVTDPKKHLEETSGLIVCPSCLAEKPPQWAAKRSHAGKDVYFCRCPYCAEVFEKNPDYYIGRLEGTVPNQGVLDHEGCCVRPE